MFPFSLNGYIYLLSRLQELGYTFVNFLTPFKDSSPVIILRHDIDVDLDAACKIAEAENQLGISSTFFVCLKSPFYNVLSKRNRINVEKINKLGHSVATHVYLESDELDPNFMEDVPCLQHFFPFLDSTLVSIHGKVRVSTIKELTKVPEIDKVYSRTINGEMAYLSDSTGDWQSGNPLKSELVIIKKPILLLTHPIWWVTKGSNSFLKFKNMMIEKCSLERPEFREFMPKFFAKYELEGGDIK